MSYAHQNNFFAQAYRTGTDSWSSIPFTRGPHELAQYLPKGSLVLDLGTGRGRLLFRLAELGYRAIGLENNQDLVERGNQEIKAKGLEKDMRFMHGDALDIPLADLSFDALVDIGLLQHIALKDHATFATEAFRVLKQGGYFFLVVLSKQTPHYLSWHPSKSDVSDFELEGVQYHFFSDEELRKLFEKDFEIKHIDHDMPHGPAGPYFSVVLLRKR